MMKKLAVAVFALAVTSLGCGSDNGGGNKDSAVDLKSGVETQTDSPAQPGPEAGAEAQADKQPALDVTADKAPVDLPLDQPVLDTAQIDAPGIDTATPLDAGRIDAQQTDTRPAIDGGVDGGSTG